MDARNRLFLAVNVVGGVLVLGSYAYGIATHWGSAQALWGGIDGPMRTVYTVNMLPATAGYLLMFGFVLRTLVDVPHWRSLMFWYVVFLASAALWMPLTFAAIDRGDPALLPWIQAVLAATGVASVAMWVHVARIRPARGGWFKPMALAAGSFLVIQCAVLDALVWPRYFHLG